MSEVKVKKPIKKGRVYIPEEIRKIFRKEDMDKMSQKFVDHLYSIYTSKELYVLAYLQLGAITATSKFELECEVKVAVTRLMELRKEREEI